MRVLPAVLLGSAAFVQAGFGQTAPQPPVIGMLNYIHAVSNLEKSIAFYHDVFGFATPAPPRPPNPAVPALINAPGALLRVGAFKIPGAPFGWEITDFGGVERKAGEARHTDPAAADLLLRVQDLGAVFGALKKAGAPIVTRSGGPVMYEGSRAVMVRDPDGYMIEVIQGRPGAAMGIT